MPRHVALLRAINVGDTGKLPMADLRQICAEAGFADVETYIASGNVVFSAEGSGDAVRTALEAGLKRFSGRDIRVFTRTATELRAIVDENPFPELPGNRVAVLFLDTAPEPSLPMPGQADEIIRPGRRELFVYYPDGQGNSKLRVPSIHTARNMNTVVKLAALAERKT